MRSSSYIALTMVGGVAAAALLACSVPIAWTGVPTPPAPSQASAIVAGRFWLDECDNSTTGPVPPPGCVVDGALARFRGNGVQEAGESFLEGWSVMLGRDACPSAGLQSARTDANGRFAFAGLAAGTYCLSAAAPGGGQEAAVVAGIWTAPSRQGLITVALGDGELRDGIDFGWDPLVTAPSPSATSTRVPTPRPTTTPIAACADRATFLEDVSFPDGAVVNPGTTFTKTWRVRNSGSCTWTTAYLLQFAGGSALGSVRSVPIPHQVPPGSSADLSIWLTAPTANGTYRSYWLLRNGQGVVFGLGPYGDVPLWVEIQVGPTVFQYWRGSYFDNRRLSGDPVLVRDDRKVDFDWKKGSPGDVVPADNFSVRWERKLKFDAGTYRFRVTADDGVRLWIDGVKVLDQWKDGSARELTSDYSLKKGDHTLKLEYYEHTGSARIAMSWERIEPETIKDWKAEYFDNRDLAGAPLLVRDEASIDHSWESGAAAPGLPRDDFSVRWSRAYTFASGIYQFTARADDGFRLYVDGVLVIDEWHSSGGGTTYSAELALGGSHDLKVEYYEHTGDAMVRFGWERLVASPSPSPSATATPTATGTGVPTASPSPSPTATGVPTATATPSPTPSEGPSETPSPTPTPTASPTATPEDEMIPTDIPAD